MHKFLEMNKSLHAYICQHNPPEPDVLAELREQTDNLKYSWLRSPNEQISFITFMLKIKKPKTILELGTFTGYSALAMALATSDETTIITCDINKIFPNIGIPFWHKAGVDHRISLRLGYAMTTMQLLNDQHQKFDFIFIDADKSATLEYVLLGLKLLVDDGLMLLDNTLWRGKVCDEMTTDKEARAMRSFNHALKSIPHIHYNLLPIGDGLTLIAKS